MIGSIFVALSGMVGHQRALSVISNNVTNMNTPGFRGSNVNFADVFGGDASGEQSGQVGAGLDSSSVLLDTRRGDKQQTGNGLDLFLDGDGFFVLQNKEGETLYTRDGRMKLKDGELVTVGQELKVMTRNAAGELVAVSVANLQTSASKPTTKVTLRGQLSQGADNSPGANPGGSDETTLDFTVFDKVGTSHKIRLLIKRDVPNDPSNPGNPGNPGNPSSPVGNARYTLTVSEDGTTIGTGEVLFSGSSAIMSLPLMLELKGVEAIPVEFDFSAVIRLSGAGNLQVDKQDGLAPGTLTDATTVDEKGVLKLTYSNGETADGPKLVLARIDDQEGLVELGNSLFSYRGTRSVSLREAGDDLKVAAQNVELSNVDLTAQFSQLILMQRGYQASSQVVSTANDMLQELLQMRGRG